MSLKKRAAALALIAGLGTLAALSVWAANNRAAAVKPTVEQAAEHTKESRCCDAK